MKRAAISMLVCGIYLVFLGFFCLIFPKTVLNGIGVYTNPDIMSRMVGMIFLIFSYIYLRTSFMDEMERFYLITAQERFTIPIFLTTFYLLGWANWILMIFGLIDFGLGLWTYIALKIDKRMKN